MGSSRTRSSASIGAQESQLQLMRYKEGEYLRKDLTKRLAGLKALSKKIL